MIRRVVLTAAATVGTIGAGLLLRPALGHLDPRVSTAEVLRLTGPLRGLPVPFVWAALGSAWRVHDPNAPAMLGRWLTWLLPERIDLFEGFAWDLAYESASLAADVTERAQRLRDAVLLLDRAQALHPSTDALPALASFLLWNRCDPDLGGAQLAAAFRNVTGEDALALSARYMERARRLRPAVDWYAWQRANLALLQGLGAWRAGRRAEAAGHVASAADGLTASDPVRAGRLRELAALIVGGGAPAPDLAEWLGQDPLLRRHRDLWGGR